MEAKKIAVLIGVVVSIIVIGVVLWFVIPSAKIDEDITIDGPANVQTIGNAYTLVDLHSVSALWSGSTVLTTVVIFSLVACCCRNKALARIHNHLKEKLKDEFIHLNSEFRVECRPDPSTEIDKYDQLAMVHR